MGTALQVLSLDLSALSAAVASKPGPAGPGDTALVLHTSGTDNGEIYCPCPAETYPRPHGILRRGHHSHAGRCLPQHHAALFHIHGPVAAVLSSLSAGATVTCARVSTPCGSSACWPTFIPPGSRPFPPHQAILSRAPDRNAEVVEKARLRFVRSSSASLPPPGYGRGGGRVWMPAGGGLRDDGASHQMASNPLPHASRKEMTVFGRYPRQSGSRDHGRLRRRPWHRVRSAEEGRDPGAECNGWIRVRSRRQREVVLRQRLVPDRGSGPVRRRRSCS